MSCFNFPTHINALCPIHVIAKNPPCGSKVQAAETYHTILWCSTVPGYQAHGPGLDLIITHPNLRISTLVIFSLLIHSNSLVHHRVLQVDLSEPAPRIDNKLWCIRKLGCADTVKDLDGCNAGVFYATERTGSCSLRTCSRAQCFASTF
jgi:hypothetical protein